MSVFQFLPSSDGMKSKSDFLRLLSRHIANAMFCQNPDTYYVKMRHEELHLSANDLCVANKGYAKSLNRVKKAFSFNRTPTTSRLTRAVSSMISPLTSSSGHNQAQQHQQLEGQKVSTPSGVMKGLRLQSCVDLHKSGSDTVSLSSQESPRSSRSAKTLMGPPPPSPARSTTSSIGSGSISSIPESSPAKIGGFTIPKTPTLCVRRASFKFLTNPMMKKH